MNTTAIIIVGLAAAVIIVFLVLKNLKDKRELEEKIKNDFPRKKAGDEDIGAEEKM